jgi:predicted DNA binding CopG/RHH family protein
MSKKLPMFKSDKEAENFLDQDLSDYISAENFAPFQFEYRPKQKSVNLRISEELLNAVRAVAHRRGIPYQRYIRQTLEASLRSSNEPRAEKRRARHSGK